MLRQGGNAVDAAVAAAFASFITESALVNIGAGGLAQVYNPASGQALVYDFFSTMPGLARQSQTLSTDLDFREILVDFGAAQQPFYIGRGSVAVPGAVAGLCLMLEELGRLPLATILAPTISWARQGVILSPEQGYITGLLESILTDTAGVAAIYAPHGRYVKAGDRLFFPELADTLTRLAQDGANLFYRGEVAGQIVADQHLQGGLLTASDLATYRVLRHSPLEIPYRDYTILLPPPASIGGALIAFALTLLAAYPLSAGPHNGPAHLRLLAEVMRLTSQARAEWEQQPPTPANSAGLAGFQPVDGLLGPPLVEKYRQRLDRILGGAEPTPLPPRPKGAANTTHISVADSQGMVVSLTTSAGESAGFVVGDTGVMLNNMLGELDLHPNGFHRLPPGQRLSTMMSPTLLLRQGRPILALGSGGSSRLRSAILQTISNVIDFALPLEAAVTAPRIHFEENQLQLEGGISAETARQLELAGYRVNRWPDRNMFFGGAHSVTRKADGRWLAAGDPRRGGAVAVVD
jgi:gamma-glutamyltranspeptidase/glutathione hydrolase